MNEHLRERTEMPGGYEVPAYGFDSEYTLQEDRRLRAQFVEQFNRMLHGEEGAAKLERIERRLAKRLSELNRRGDSFSELVRAASQIPAELMSGGWETLFWLQEVEGAWRKDFPSEVQNEVQRIAGSDRYSSASGRRNQLLYFFDALRQGVKVEAHYVEWRLRVLRAIIDRNDETAGVTRFEHAGGSILCNDAFSEEAEEEMATALTGYHAPGYAKAACKTLINHPWISSFTKLAGMWEHNARPGVDPHSKIKRLKIGTGYEDLPSEKKPDFTRFQRLLFTKTPGYSLEDFQDAAQTS
jgi:hypothetical protein